MPLAKRFTNQKQILFFKIQFKMKKRFLLTSLILSLVLVFSFVSCDKSNDDEKENNGLVTDDDNRKNLSGTISAKWEISDSNSPYASFEFSRDGNYIVILKNSDEANLRSFNASFDNSFVRKNYLRSSESNLPSVHFGTYRIEGEKIILSGFGFIDIISITDKEFSFSFTLEETGEKNTFATRKSETVISTSDKTDILCKTWVIQKLTDLNGDETEYRKEERENIIGTVVLYSRAGTYLVMYTGKEATLAEWQWANKEETKFYYSWDNWTENWEEENIVTIIQLNNNSLIFKEGDVLWHLTCSE